MRYSEFNDWLDNFIKEKNINSDETFSIEVDGVGHLFDYKSLIEQIKNASEKKQEVIRKKIEEIDFCNADVKAYFRHLAIPLAKGYNSIFLKSEDYPSKMQLDRLEAKDDIKKLDLLNRKILDIDFTNIKAIDLKETITTQINEKIAELMTEYHIPNKEYLELVLENKDYKKQEERKEMLAEDRLYMIWENCSSKEIAEILRNNYLYTDQEILDEFDDEETIEEVKNYLMELNEIEQSSKNVILDNGYVFRFENEFYFSKLKDIYENSQDFVGIRQGLEIATMTNSDITKEAFLVKYDHNIEIIYNFYNKNSKEMETYEYEVFDMNEIKSKEELIEKMKEKLANFEEKYNKLGQDEENLEVQ